MVTRTLSTLKDQNFLALTTVVKQDLQKWNCLPLSLAGRVQTVKTNIVPWYLYLFQYLPIYLPRSFFNRLNSIISSFIWAGKRARANRSLLQINKIAGGLGLPNLLGYYWAANAQKDPALVYLTSPHLSWCQLEASSSSSSPQAIACGTLSLSTTKFTSNPIVTNTLKIWN